MERSNQKSAERTERQHQSHSIRVSNKTYEALRELMKNVNGKERGCVVKADGLIALALSLIGAKEIKELQEASLSNADRLEQRYQQYLRENAFITKDQYLGRIMNGEITLETI